MKKGLWRAAAAACVGACALCNLAQAAVLEVGGTAPYDDGFQGIELSIDTSSHTGYFSTILSNENPAGNQYQYSTSGTGYLSGLTVSIFNDGEYSIRGNLNVPNAAINYTPDSFLDPVGITTYRQVIFSFDLQHSTEFFTPAYELNGIEVNDPSINPLAFVPLPSAAPLFATAILALGSVTYARRRRPTAAYAAGR